MKSDRQCTTVQRRQTGPRCPEYTETAAGAVTTWPCPCHRQNRKKVAKLFFQSAPSSPKKIVLAFRQVCSRRHCAKVPATRLKKLRYWQSKRGKLPKNTTFWGGKSPRAAAMGFISAKIRKTPALAQISTTRATTIMIHHRHATKNGTRLTLRALSPRPPDPLRPEKEATTVSESCVLLLG